MKFSVRFKAMLGIGIACLMGVLVTIVMERISFQRGFLEYLNRQQLERMEAIANFLGRYYEQQGGWGQLVTAPEGWERALAFFERRFEENQRRRPPGDRLQGLGPNVMEGQAFNLGLLTPDGQLIAGSGDLLGRNDLMRVAVTTPFGRSVGELVSPPMSRFSGQIEQQFTRAQLRRSVLVALIALALVTPLALLLASQMLRQVQQLAQGVHRLTAGRYDQQVQSTRSDELGQLARDINKLGQTLSANQESQRRWIADISHELRTPVAILAGEIDALVDGVREPNARELQSLAAEVDRLRRLIEDLYTLSRSDVGALSYRMEKLDLRDPLESCLDRFSDRLSSRELDLQVDLPDQSCMVRGDGDRLEQLINNLLENSSRYTDPGGKVFVSLSREGNRVVLRVEDSSPGVSTDALPRLTERLFRAEQSRNREYGGAGLGLAIVANIVKAHGAEMDISASSLGGLKVEVRFGEVT